jgi:hypothetical protein
MLGTCSEGSENASEFNVASVGVDEPRSFGAGDGAEVCPPGHDRCLIARSNCT